MDPLFGTTLIFPSCFFDKWWVRDGAVLDEGLALECHHLEGLWLALEPGSGNRKIFPNFILHPNLPKKKNPKFFFFVKKDWGKFVLAKKKKPEKNEQKAISRICLLLLRFSNWIFLCSVFSQRFMVLPLLQTATFGDCQHAGNLTDWLPKSFTLFFAFFAVFAVFVF